MNWQELWIYFLENPKKVFGWAILLEFILWSLSYLIRPSYPNAERGFLSFALPFPISFPSVLWMLFFMFLATILLHKFDK